MPEDASVVIAAYNATTFIRDTLESVFRQTRTPAEIVLVDDASPDGTGELAEEIARSSPIPLRVIRLAENAGGPATPLNVGIETATSGLIATLDHDDRMRPDRLERQMACWEADPSVSLVLCRCEPVGGGERERLIADYVAEQFEQMRDRRLTRDSYHIPSHRAREASAEGCFTLTCSNLLFPKTTWSSCGGFDPALRLSCDFGFQVAATAIGDLAYVDDVLNDWTVRGDSLYRKSGRMPQIKERILVLDRLDREWERDTSGDRIEAALGEEWVSYAYEAREAGAYRESLRGYLRGLGRQGSRREAFAGLVKLAPGLVLRRLNGARLSAD